jgi:hypothetical protein
MDLFKAAPLLERAVIALERIAVNTHQLNLSAKNIAKNTAVSAGIMEAPNVKLPYPDA